MTNVKVGLLGPKEQEQEKELNMTSLFANLNTAKTASNGDYFPPIDAKYVCRIVVCKMLTPRKKPAAICVELDVIESDHPELVGKRFSFYQGSEGEYFDSECRTFMMRVMGFGAVSAEGEAWANANSAAFWEAAIDPVKQPLQGMLVRLTTWPKVTKANQKTITIQQYEPYYDSHAEALEAMRTNGKAPRLDLERPAPPVGPMFGGTPPLPNAAPPLPNAAAWVPPPGATLSPDGKLFYDPAQHALGWQTTPAR